MFSFEDKCRNYLCDNNGLCANLTLFLVFFKKVCAFFCFFAEVNGIYMCDFDYLCFTKVGCGSAVFRSKASFWLATALAFRYLCFTKIGCGSA